MPRKLIQPPKAAGIKDAAGMYVSPQAPLPEPVADVVSADVDIGELQDKSRLILQREIKNLSVESSSGKLAPNSARDLVNYVKLLADLAKMEKDALDGKTTEELEALLAKRKSM